jgi:hypothetical protein
VSRPLRSLLPRWSSTLTLEIPQWTRAPVKTIYLWSVRRHVGTMGVKLASQPEALHAQRAVAEAVVGNFQAVVQQTAFRLVGRQLPVGLGFLAEQDESDQRTHKKKSGAGRISPGLYIPARGFGLLRLLLACEHEDYRAQHYDV